MIDFSVSHFDDDEGLSAEIISSFDDASESEADVTGI